ncbi:MAG: hypothetical protein GY908_05150, partial [Flavobacteriales bacterium]|nr:hypothetical protein [Flavobacteriales bacterium]
NDKTVQFYSGEPGQGVAAVFPIDGKSVEIPSLKRHYLNKKIASIVSGPDVSIQLFSGKNYNGESTIIEGGKGSQNLGQWVNKASSLKIIPKTNTEYSPQPNCNENAIIRIYEHANFGGKCVSYNQDVPFLEDMNDRMSSYKIKSGYKVQFYEHGNWDGKYFTRSSDNSFSDEFNDSISSIKIIK